MNYMQKTKIKIIKKYLLISVASIFIFSFFNLGFSLEKKNVLADTTSILNSLGNTVGVNNLGSITGGSAADCGDSGFQKVGGVCFPTSSQTGLSDASVTTILTNLLSWLLGIFGILSIMAFVISGIQYLSSAGSDDMIKTAKKNMTWSIVGILVGLSGYVIIKAIAAALTGSSITY